MPTTTLSGSRRRLPRKGEVQQPALTGRLTTTDAKAASATFVISTQMQDRDGDIVLAQGFQLRNYSKNPRVLLNHAGMPIGSARDPAGKLTVSILADRVVSTVYFHLKTLESEQVAELVLSRELEGLNWIRAFGSRAFGRRRWLRLLEDRSAGMVGRDHARESRGNSDAARQGQHPGPSHLPGDSQSSGATSTPAQGLVAWLDAAKGCGPGGYSLACRRSRAAADSPEHGDPPSRESPGSAGARRGHVHPSVPTASSTEALQLRLNFSSAESVVPP